MHVRWNRDRNDGSSSAICKWIWREVTQEYEKFIENSLWQTVLPLALYKRLRLL